MGNENENLESKENQISNKVRDLEPICRTLRVEINRLALPSNGIVVLKDDQSEKKVLNVPKVKEKRIPSIIKKKRPNKTFENVVNNEIVGIQGEKQIENPIKKDEEPLIKVDDANKVDKINEMTEESKTMDKPSKNVKTEEQPTVTPSRVSNRLKNRKVKFNVLKLLSSVGNYDSDEDGFIAKKPRKIIPKDQVVKKVAKFESFDNAVVGVVGELKASSEHTVEENIKGKPVIDETEKIAESTNEENYSHNDSVKDAVEECYEKDKVIVEKAICLKLTEPAKKQVVNISLPSLNTSNIQNKNNLHVGLGPDIVIRRIKINKKALDEATPPLPPEEASSSMSKEKTVTNEKSVEDEIFDRLLNSTNVPETPKEGIKDAPKLIPIKLADLQSKSVDSPPKKKNKLEKIIAKTDNVDSEVVVIFKQTAPAQVSVTEAKKRKQKRVLFQNRRKDETPEPDEIVHSPSVSPLREPEHLSDEFIPEKKITKAPPPTKQVPTAKKSITPSKPKSFHVGEKEKHDIYEPVDLFAVTGYEDDAFEKFFFTENRLCEHNDSLDSDSSDEDPNLLSHFLDLKKGKQPDVPENPIQPFPINKTAAKSTDFPIKLNENATIYDLMQEISSELPTWNIHVLPNSKNICLAQLDIKPNVDIPVMRKLIRFDSEYNAKVFINQTLVSEMGGVYDSYESIKQLIYLVDDL